MEIPCVHLKTKSKKLIVCHKFWKLPIEKFSLERRIHTKGQPVAGFLKEVESEIRKKIADRKRRQTRWALAAKEQDTTKATLSAKSVAFLFGYKSPQSGSKLRNKYFSVIPITPDEAKPKFNKSRGRFEEPTREIAL